MPSSLVNLAANDVPFVMRVVVQSLLPGKPLALAAEAQALADATSARLSADTAVPAAQGFEELCPACGTLISLSSVADARCARGHAWGASYRLGAQMMRAGSPLASDRPVLGHLLRSLDAARTDMRWLRAQGLPPNLFWVGGQWEPPPACGGELGCGGAPCGRAQLSVLWERIRYPGLKLLRGRHPDWPCPKRRKMRSGIPLAQMMA